ncbi:MAG: hypothetical protein KC442_14330 [Thermomicrobiales bacterium]|nr:hypothetical protein [Thermomicrobiales bacterium]
MNQNASHRRMEDATRGKVVRPQVWRRQDRHVLLAVSHTSEDPALHRTFQVRASFQEAQQGWSAFVSEQNFNDQFGEWSLLPGQEGVAWPTAAACLGWATEALVTACDQESQEP